MTVNVKLSESKNGSTVEVIQENGKSTIKIFGRRTPESVKAAAHLQYSIMPPAWIMRQVLKTL